MFIAIDKDNNRVEIENADKTKEYFCPVCGEKLSIRAKESISVKTHFAHKRNSQCVDDWNHDMSEWHLNWQRRFPTECREVVIEHNGTKHRADVCIGKTIIEFQHSPLSSEEFGKRNEFYTNCGYKVVWVFDAEGKIASCHPKAYGIDPNELSFVELCWKRKNVLFLTKPSSKLEIFIQYKVEKQDIMLKLKNVSSKGFKFYRTYPNYLLIENFLKEYGANVDPRVRSVSVIIEQTKDIYKSIP
ncbi:MAG: hypothetical protein J6A90_04725 [Clostridia bacterium]|nr:hypothetical protein [Clostridia bacterium]